MQLYDLRKTFAQNYNSTVFTGTIPTRVVLNTNQWTTLLGHQINIPVGIAACPITVVKCATIVPKLGADILTYKTVRSKPFIGHPLPNIGFINYSKQLTRADIGKKITVVNGQPAQEHLSNAISFGIGCNDWDFLQQDIARVKASLLPGQLFIVSVFGKEQEERTVVQDYAYTAQKAAEAGAQVIEINLSCPNSLGKLWYTDVYGTLEICKAVLQVVQVPVILKIGLFGNQQEMELFFKETARVGVRGICGVNSVAMQPVTEDNKPFFGKYRKVSGVGGNCIRELAKKFTVQAKDIITKQKLDLTLLACGGVMLPEHINEFFNCGADAVLSATGMMWDPCLLHTYATLFHARSHSADLVSIVGEVGKK